MTDIAQELSRRASPRYIGEQVRGSAVNKASEWKDQLTSSPVALALLGGALGAAIGGSLARNNRRRQRFADGGWRDDGYPAGRLRYASAGPSGTVVRTGDLEFEERPPYTGDSYDGGGERVRDKIAEGTQQVKDKAAETTRQVKDKASDVIDSVRERMPSADDLKHTADENPGLVALGGFALGAIAALLLPVSRKEREMLEPVKQRAGEAMGTLSDKIGQTVDEAQSKLAPPRGQSGQPGEPRAQDRGPQPGAHDRGTQPRTEARPGDREPYAPADPYDTSDTGLPH